MKAILLVLPLSFLFMVFSLEANAQCQSAEIALDSIDNDCDGATDETTQAYNTVPYVFDSAGDLRTNKDLNPTYNGYYGGRMNYRWGIGTSNQTKRCRFTFERFYTESGYDFLVFPTTSYSGFQTQGGSWTSDWFDTGYGSTAMTELAFTTDYSYEYTGFRTTAVECEASRGSGTITFKAIPSLRGVEGILLHAKDDAYFSFVLPANREAWVNLDHRGASQNFDILASVAGDPVKTPSACNTALTACSTDDTGEVLHIPSTTSDRTINMRIHSSSGAGRFQLFVIIPKATFSTGNSTVEVGIDREATGWEVGRTNEILTQFVAQVFAQTDGQFIVHKPFSIDNDVTYALESEYDIWFDESAQIDDWCTPAQYVHYPLDYIEVAKFFWRGEVRTGCGWSAANTRGVGLVLGHEWGHYDFELNDEYNYSSQKSMCSHSMMGTYAFNYLEHCNSANHGTEPEPGESGAGGTNDWSLITAIYTSMSIPSHGGTPISSDYSTFERLREVLAPFLTFSWI